MTYRQIVNHVKEVAQNYGADEFDKFVKEFPHEDWMDAMNSDGAEGDVVDEILSEGFAAAHEA